MHSVKLWIVKNNREEKNEKSSTRNNNYWSITDGIDDCLDDVSHKVSKCRPTVPTASCRRGLYGNEHQ
jgi:hypothetical protein